MAEYPFSKDPDVAVLYERIDNVITKVDLIDVKLDAQELKRETANNGLEKRVEHIEKQIAGVRWFVLGIAAGGGVLGGVVSSVITRASGG